MAKRRDSASKPKRGRRPRAAASPAAAATTAAPGVVLDGTFTCASNIISPAQRRTFPPVFGDALRMRGLNVHGPVAAGNFPGGLAIARPDNPLAAVVDTLQTWNRGARLKIRFLDRQPDFRDQVETIVRLWEAAADIKFEFVTTGNAEIRITFRETRAFYSLLGKEALGAPQQQHTMSLGFERGESRPEVFRRLILHEFGHAIGLMHEHQNPVGGGIQWNWPVAIAYYQQRLPPGMPVQQIVAQLAAVPESRRFEATPFDADSVMLYQIPRELVHSGWQPEWMNDNTNLSATDKATAARIYGPAPGTGPATPPAPKALTVNGPSVEESIAADAEVDRFTFNVSAQGVYQAEADGEALVRITLANASFNPLQGFLPADSLTTGRGAKLPCFLDAGSFGLLVSASQFLPTSRGTYRIRVVSL